MAHLVLSAAYSHGITVARVIAPDHRVSASLECEPDGRSQLLPDDLVRLSRSASNPVVLDCRMVEQIDSAGVGIILSLWKGLRVAKHAMALCVTENVRQVFDVARLTRLIPCAADLAECCRVVLPEGAISAPGLPSTTEDWFHDPDPYHRLETLPPTTSTRKLRLFAVACGRRIAHLLGNAPCRRAMDIAEAYADGGATDDELRSIHAEATASLLEAEIRETVSAAAGAAAATADPDPRRAAWYAAAWSGEIDGPSPVATLVDDVFGNPFEPTSIDPDWLTPSVRNLAWQVDHEADFDLLPDLGSALQTAGCDNPNLLMHCQDTGGHTRGCWVVDLILGK